MARHRVGECVYCGKTARLTIDHIPPQALFAKSIPPTVVKVPSCESCNHSASRDDEYFKTVLVLKDRAGNHPEARSRRASVLRALALPRKRRFASQLLRQIWPVHRFTRSGLYAGRGSAFSVDLARLDQVVVRITAGLHWHHLQKRVAHGFRVWAMTPDGLAHSPIDLERLEVGLLQPVMTQPMHVVGNGVMRYWYSIAADDPRVTAWAYQFYEDVFFAAATLARANDLPGESS